jgi:DNA-binding response OmpR family regulator
VSKPPILIIGSNSRNLELLTQFLGKEGYKTRQATTLEQFADVLNSGEQISLALVDITGFDRSIWQYCEQCSELGVPLFVISPPPAPRAQHESLEHGAQGVLYKPLVVKELLHLVKIMSLENG